MGKVGRSRTTQARASINAMPVMVVASLAPSLSSLVLESLANLLPAASAACARGTAAAALTTMEVASLAPLQSSSVLESESSSGGSSSDSKSDARPSSVGSSRSSIIQARVIDTMAERSSSSSSSSSSSTLHRARSLSRCLL
eukprot:2176856-Rhodomonas_salina.2